MDNSPPDSAVYRIFQARILKQIQAPLSMGFPRQGYWNRSPFPTQGVISDPGIEHVSFASSAMAGGFFTMILYKLLNYICIFEDIIKDNAIN